MGWSCTRDAALTMDRITQACVKQTGTQNVYEDGGQRYMFETSRKEHDDGAITGSIWRYLESGHVRRCGSFRIEGDGSLSRGSGFMRRVANTVGAKP